MSIHFLTLFGVLYLICWEAESAKILMLPLAVKSHKLDQACLAEELVSRGNEVYFIVHEDLQFSAMLEKLHGAHILAFPREAYGEAANSEELMDRMVLQSLEGKGDVSQITKWLMKICEGSCRTFLLENEKALSQLEMIKADVLIPDYFVVWKCPYLLSLRLGVPTIAFGSFVEPWLARIPYLPSYVPTYFLPFTDRMTFLERAKNFFVAVMIGFFSPFHADYTDVIDAYKVYGNFSDIDSLLEKTALWLYSTHPVLDYPKPTMPNVVAAGGMTTAPGKPLTGDILDTVNRSNKGVILVSFGSVASHFPAQVTQRFLAVFAKFPDYTFLWRFNNKNNLEFPANVIPKEWLPQNDLLASDKVKLLVTHCGQRSLFEAVYHAKPLLGVPLFYDQEYNAKFLEDRGFGESINIHTFTEDEMRQKMAMVLTDESYRIKMEAASEIFRDDPETPRERAARMVEQVIKHGADHLRSSAYDLSWYQYWMLDIAAVVCTVSFVVLYLSYRIVIRLR